MGEYIFRTCSCVFLAGAMSIIGRKEIAFLHHTYGPACYGHSTSPADFSDVE